MANNEDSTELHVSRSPVHLDGRTLEGGGQLVRIAIALSALTGRPVTIDHVRGNRQGKQGLKGSHLAAVQLLAEISGSKVSGGIIGSRCMSFIPQVDDFDDDSTPSRQNSSQAQPTQSRCRDDGSAPNPTYLVPLSKASLQSEYDIRLPTAGSIFLVFQAVYPYLLHAGSQAPEQCIRLNVTGGTNVSLSPSFDYASQVMVPNFSKLGLPRLAIVLHKRGWSSGPTDLGTVSFLIHPLGASKDADEDGKISEFSAENADGDAQQARAECLFPLIDLLRHERGKITQIDITVLAPDSLVSSTSQNSYETRKQKRPEGRHQGNTNSPITIRTYAEEATHSALRRGIRTADQSLFDMHSSLHQSATDPFTQDSDGDPIPINIHTSEPTYHRSHLYILIVAHTSTGFRIGHDALFGSQSCNQPKKPKRNKKMMNEGINSAKEHRQHGALSVITDLVDQCVEGFIREISGQVPDSCLDPLDVRVGKRACLDLHMRDQIVVFEALGEICGDNLSKKDGASQQEDERYWTLHTKTAQWVCQQMLKETRAVR